MSREFYAIHNPLNKDTEELPIIYGFNNGGSPGFYTGMLLAEDGTALGSHLCSHEDFMLQDLGILHGSAPRRHKDFMNHYPEGYRMDFVSSCDVKSHAGLMNAYKLNQDIQNEII